jgi:CheY-like chemotaxis protein
MSSASMRLSSLPTSNRSHLTHFCWRSTMSSWRARRRLDCKCACRPAVSGTCHVQCRDGRVALQLPLCDYRLADGGRRLDAGLRLRQRSGMRIPLLPIIGETAPDRPRRIRQSGVAVLSKPVDPDRLPCAVEAALQDAREFPGFLKGRWTLPQGWGYRTAGLFDAARVRARARASRWVAIASGLTNGPGPAQLLVGMAVSNGA